MDYASHVRQLLDDTARYLKKEWPDGIALRNPDLMTGISPAATPPVPAVPGAAPDAGMPFTLESLRDEVAVCTRCGLAATRTGTVFGEGDPAAPIMVIGQAPGSSADRAGKPFVDEAGELLTKIIAAIGFNREQIYLTNALKCRMPEKRDPKPDETAACRTHLERQIALVRPRAICTLGRFAAWSLLQTNDSMQNLRGKVHRYGEIPVVATYHPSALLRNQKLKRPTWEDVQLLRKTYDEELARG